MPPRPRTCCGQRAGVTQLQSGSICSPTPCSCGQRAGVTQLQSTWRRCRRRNSCGQRAGVTQLQFVCPFHSDSTVVDSGQASLSYNGWQCGERDVRVVDSGQASLSYNQAIAAAGLAELWTAGRRHSVTISTRRQSTSSSCGQRAGVTQLQSHRTAPGGFSSCGQRAGVTQLQSWRVTLSVTARCGQRAGVTQLQ